MAEYIERVAAMTVPVLPKEYREYQTFNLDDAYEQGWNDALKNLKDIPAADVAPVRHGEWVITKEYNEVIDTEITKYTCSVCKDYRLSGYGLSKATNYCPNCGAKMDLEAPPHV